MKSIRAFNLPCVLKKSFEAEFPVPCEILSVTVIKGMPVLSCIAASDSKEKVKREFRFYGIEEAVHDRPMIYIGDILVGNGKICLHLFEIERPGTGLLLPNA